MNEQSVTIADDKIVFFSISSKNYAAYIRVLAQTVKRHYPNSQFYWALADKLDQSSEINPLHLPIIEADALNIPDFDAFAFRYDIMEFNTAIKPFVFKHLIQQTKAEHIVYLDPDLYLTSRLDKVEQAFLNDYSIVLTPHLTSPVAADDIPDDRQMLRAGIFNLGFIAVKTDSIGQAMLNWWADRLTHYCCNEVEKGLFVDQKWMNLTPCFFEKVYILRDHQYNLAYWNLVQRQVSYANHQTYVDGQPLAFVHFSGVNPLDASKFSKYQSRYTLATIGDLRYLYQQYIDELLASDYKETKNLPYHYAAFNDGEIIPTIIRKLFRNLIPESQQCQINAFNLNSIQMIIFIIKQVGGIRLLKTLIHYVGFKLTIRYLLNAGYISLTQLPVIRRDYKQVCSMSQTTLKSNAIVKDEH